MAKHDPFFKLAVGNPQGDRFSVYRVWTTRNKPDVYVASRPTGEAVKVSIHEDTTNVSIDYGFLKSQTRRVPLPGGTRHFAQLPRSNIAPGISRVLVLVFATSHLIRTEEPYTDPDPIIWITPAATCRAVEVNFILTEAHVECDSWPSANSMGTRLAGKLLLADGSTIWAVYREIDPPLVQGIPATFNIADAKTIKRDPGYLRDDVNRALVISESDGVPFLIEVVVTKRGEESPAASPLE